MIQKFQIRRCQGDPGRFSCHFYDKLGTCWFFWQAKKTIAHKFLWPKHPWHTLLGPCLAGWSPVVEKNYMLYIPKTLQEMSSPSWFTKMKTWVKINSVGLLAFYWNKFMRSRGFQKPSTFDTRCQCTCRLDMKLILPDLGAPLWGKLHILLHW